MSKKKIVIPDYVSKGLANKIEEFLKDNPHPEIELEELAIKLKRARKLREKWISEAERLTDEYIEKLDTDKFTKWRDKAESELNPHQNGRLDGLMIHELLFLKLGKRINPFE